MVRAAYCAYLLGVVACLMRELEGLRRPELFEHPGIDAFVALHKRPPGVVEWARSRGASVAQRPLRSTPVRCRVR